MVHKSKIRENLLAAYRRLSPPAQAVMQLCSVIHEPTDAATLLKCFRKIGLTFAEGNLTDVAELESYIDRLQTLKLLNKNLQCHEAIVEICSRDALAHTSGSKLGSAQERLGQAEAWSADHPPEAVCFSCQNHIAGFAFSAPAGPLCLACTQKELRVIAGAEDLSKWTAAQFRDALSPEGTLPVRFTILWRISEVLSLISPIADKSMGEDQILKLLVDNLGYDAPHPLTEVVRETAVDACFEVGARVVPWLIRGCVPEPWPFYANVVRVLAALAPPLKQGTALLGQAASSPNPEVRRSLLTGLGFAMSGPAPLLILKLRNDPDPMVRELARKLGRQRLPTPLKARPKMVFSPTVPNRYVLMARTVQEEIRALVKYGVGMVSTYCHRAMRDLRIGLYSQDSGLFNKSYEHMFAYCPETEVRPDPLIRICSNPFDPVWFRTLAPSLQGHILAEILYHTLFSLDADDEALAYSLDPQVLDPISVRQNPGFYHHLISRLLVAGRLAEAEELLAEVSQSVFACGMQGWVLFLKEQYAAAIASFEADLKQLRHNHRSRTTYFGGIEGLYFILALLMVEPSPGSQKISGLIDAALNRHKEKSILVGCYRALKAVVHSQSGEPDGARKMLSGSAGDEKGLGAFFHLLASYWIDGQLTQEEIDTVSDLFIKSREVGLNWLAMECAELLCRAEENTPVRRNTIEKIRQETGVHSFVAAIRVEEPWKKSLRALTEIASGAQEAPIRPTDARLVWLLDFHNGAVSVQPLEQKRTVRGGWTKGRTVALSRLYGDNRPSCLSPRDHAICAAIEREARYYYDTQFRYNTNKLLPALVGHPLLFLEKSPGVSVEVVKGEPEVLVTRAASGILIRFSLETQESRVALVQETPTRFKVVELSDQHLRIAKILGQNGLKVPASAAREVMDAVAGISSQVTVHSAIGGVSKDIQEITADAVPRMHIVPSGSGFRFEMFVQPFGSSGPYLKPGTGMENVIAEIDGKLMHTRRELNVEEKLAGAVESACPALAAAEESERQWTVDDLQECLQILLNLKNLQDSGEVVLAWPEGEKLRVTREVSFDHLRLQIRSKTDWFEVGGELQVDDHLVLDMKRLLELVHADSTRFLPLGEGQFVTLTRELRKRLEDLADFSERHGKELRLHPLAALAVEDFTDQLPQLDADHGWKARLANMHSALQLQPAVPSTLKAELRDYQVEGYQWLARLAHMGLGGCLADDMGLGKTLQALALILDRAPASPTLVVAPTSVCMNWVAEANRFAPTLNPIIFGGSNREQMVTNLGGMDVLVVSYGLLYQEAELLASIQWGTIILDEAQMIKNFAAKRSQAAMNLKGDMRVITTGTPIENHLTELWTLFNFINPGFLGSQERFNTRFATPIERNNNREARKRLKKLVQPFILRRTKAQVLEELPPRTEVVLQVEMSAEEAAFYEALRQQALERLERDDSPVGQKHLKILAEIMKLRQACCHPRLVMPRSSISGSKLELFGEVVSELLENRHKALVFSQFVGHLKLLREYLDARKLDYRYLDGSTPPKERKRQVDAFQAGWGDLFLISLKAGGLGLNLTAADYVIHMDPWWNPAVEDQASDRAHRIGQQRPVTVYRLVTQNTIEEKILKLHQEKRDLASSLLDGSDMVGRMSTEELLKLIRDQ